ncbi:MAG TPA: flagellar biosynthesis anti-sigma factor FlgM, partial [Fibrobacteraceae bacterium]|nr:flagellar biosynthesis anti-sigma factor FlgM [Fibrobacteraceae bacterium]
QKVNGAKEEKKSSTTSSSSSSDTVSISKEAKAASEAARVTANAEAMPDVREDRVAEVKSKVESGYYNTPEFQDQLAERLLKEFGSNG